MKDIAIFGAGGFGKEVACLINIINKKDPTWNLIGFFDDGKEIGIEISHYGKVLGGVKEVNEWQDELSLVIAIGNPTIVQKIVHSITNPHVDYPNIIHPNFGTSDITTFSIGQGNIIQGGCWASCDVTISDFNVFNGSIVLGHDVRLGSYNTFMPAVRISGEVTIGNDNFFGVSSVVLQQLTIGNHVRLAAGSVLMTKPKDGNLYIGVPAKKTSF